MIEGVRKGQKVVRTDCKKLNRISRGEECNHWNKKRSDEFQWLDIAKKWIHDLEDWLKEIAQNIKVKKRCQVY